MFKNPLPLGNELRVFALSCVPIPTLYFLFLDTVLLSCPNRAQFVILLPQLLRVHVPLHPSKEVLKS